MPPKFIFITLISISCIGLVVSFFRAFSSKHNLLELIPLIGATSWAIGFTWIYTQNPQPLGMGLLFNATILGSLHLFCAILSKKHINVPRWHLLGGVVTTLGLFLTPLTSITAVEKIAIYSFFGILNTLLLLLFCERLHHIFKANNHNNNQLLISLSIISGTFFLLFCDMTVSPYLGTSRPQLIAGVLIFIYPILHIGVNKTNSVPRRLSISRPVAFQTTLFSISGLYLMGLSGTSHIAKNFGLDFTSTIVLISALLFPLSYLLTSSKIRKNILVWINKHFFSSQFDYRETWRKLNKAMTPNLQGKEVAITALNAALESINHHEGAYYRLHRGRWVCAAYTHHKLTPMAEGSISDMINALPNKHWIVDIDEAVRKPEIYNNKFEPRDFINSNVHWLIPVSSNNTVIGILLVLGKNKPHWPLNWETRDFVSTLAQHVENYISSQKTLEELRESAQFAAFNQTSSFVIHDMKNIFAQLKMLNDNALSHRDNPDFVNDAFETLSSMEARMNKMLNKLTNKKNNLNTSNCANYSLNSLYEAVMDDFSNTGSELSISELPVLPPKYQFYLELDKFRNVIKHLVDNALYAIKNTEGGSVFILFEIKDNCAIISINDTGVGMSEEFIENKLFKPFETTKGNSGMGLGVFDAKQFAEKHNGELSVKSTLKKGTSISLSLPWIGAVK